MRWRASRLLSAPHRLGFFAAALVFALSALWWAVVLSTRAAGIALPWVVAPPIAHGLLMSAGFMPLFIIGFLFTAGPRWLGQPPVQARSLLAPVLLMLSGWPIALAGFHWVAGLAALGVAFVAAGWSAIALRFVRLLRASTVPDRTHAFAVAWASSIGALALWAIVFALASGEYSGVRAITQVLLWGWFAPTFATVSHRMIPFFTAAALPVLDAWRPNWLLWLQLGALAFAGAGMVAELFWWPLPAALRWVQAAVEAPVGVLLLWVSVRWGLVQSLRIRLLAMLYGGFVWLGLAMALLALSHALQALGHPGLGLAPLHALTMGYLGATLIAMTTRVAAGHSGRPLAADDLAWTLYWLLQAAALLRLTAALWGAVEMHLLLCAIGAWLMATVGWALRYGSWLGRPRIDGRPG